MNANATTGMRELTAQELDQVTGGLNYNVSEDGMMWATAAIIGTAFVTGLGALLEWLFG